jgi:hypothetical protein
MSDSEPTGELRAPAAPAAPVRDAGEAAPPSLHGAPALRASLLLRTTAVVTFLAAVMGVLVAPGLRGLAKDRIVDSTNQLNWTLTYLMTGLVMAAIVMAVFELTHTMRVHAGVKAAIVLGAGTVMALAAPALARPLPTAVSAAIAVAAGVTTLVGAYEGFRASHTRAVALVMAAFGLAGLLRVGAWYLARTAGDAGNTRLYATACGVATAGLVFEGLGQMIAAAWLGTRSRVGGQLLSSAAIAIAWLLTRSAANGASVSATWWEAGAHTALATASGLPQPYGPPVLTAFLLAASILLAGVAAVQARQVVAVVVALSLSLFARGAFDIPVHALAAAAAGLWITLAVTDQRAMWRSLIASREVSPGRTSGPRPAARAG